MISHMPTVDAAIEAHRDIANAHHVPGTGGGNGASSLH